MIRSLLTDVKLQSYISSFYHSCGGQFSNTAFSIKTAAILIDRFQFWLLCHHTSQTPSVADLDLKMSLLIFQPELFLYRHLLC